MYMLVQCQYFLKSLRSSLIIAIAKDGTMSFLSTWRLAQHHNYLVDLHCIANVVSSGGHDPYKLIIG